MNSFLDNLTSTQRKLVIAIMAIVVYVVATTVSYSIISPILSKTASSNLKTANLPGTEGMVEEDPSIPRTEECVTNGSMQTKNARDFWQDKRPLAIMVENHIESRPQSGLSHADVVYEAVAEGGITRFMAIYYCGANFGLNDIQVGPVRSARTYYLDWLSEYDGLYAHVGGANTPGPANALGQIIDFGIKDLNQFSIGFPTFWRDYQRLGRAVATEHTMYSSTKKLWEVGAKKGWKDSDEDGIRWDKNFVPWKFKNDSAGGESKTIEVSFWDSQGDYKVDWTYDSSCNCYKRKNGGQDHTDLNNKKQISPKVVIVRLQQELAANDGYENNVHRLYGNHGLKDRRYYPAQYPSGDALILQDGKVIKGKWNKANRLAREKFTDEKGVELELNRGQIWLQTVPIGSTVKY
jgi:hypothetical protein